MEYKKFYSTLVICLHMVKWSRVLLCITNHSIKQSFVNTQLKCQAVLFDPEIGPCQVNGSHNFEIPMDHKILRYQCITKSWAEEKT